MSRTDARATEGALSSGRLAGGARRGALLDAAAALVGEGDIEDVSMDAVAERAGVSRPLVYKHFTNRRELLAAVYQRESALLHDELSAQVMEADRVEDMFRALIRGALRAQGERGATLAALRAAGAADRAWRDEQRGRDRITVRWFARRASRQYGLEEGPARAAVAILLSGIESVLSQWRRRPTPQHAKLLEEAYVSLAIGGLTELARSDGPANSSA